MKMYRKATLGRQAGFNLLEVVIGIAVFFIGLLALASLQGSLTRSMADAKVRSEASNLAERAIEQLRGFTTIAASTGVFDYTTGVFGYGDIVDGTGTVTSNGVQYTLSLDVTDYWYQNNVGVGTFTTTAPSGAGASNFKRVEVVVAWDTNASLRSLDESGGELLAINLNPTNDIVIGGTERTGIKLSSVIPALVTSASYKVSEESESELPTPEITYQPGQNPEVIALSLGDDKFKESLTPVPDVIRSDELVETSFDVITYSSNGPDSFFLRREEFTAVSCECRLRAANATFPARRPVIWAGDEYARGHFVTKPYGESANNQQSSLCDSCCRDHHDGGSSADDHADTATNRYGPFKAASEYYTTFPFAGDHKHYTATGALAGVNSVYLEACRMVRVDGFNRVMQDFRREDQYIFPQDFLDAGNEIDVYSAYVTGAAAAFEDAVTEDYEQATPSICIGGPSPCVAEAPLQGAYPLVLGTDGSGNPTELPTWTDLDADADEIQQLRSRGIYIDYLSQDLRAFIDCLQAGGDKDSCEVEGSDVILDRTGSENVLELLPFFDVQRTFLDRWTETPANSPVDASNEELADNNAHSRGVVSEDAVGGSDVSAASHRGNLGFTDTQPIDPEFMSYVTEADLNVQSLGGGSTPVPPGSVAISGTLTETVSGSPTIAISQGGDAVCNRTVAGFDCFVPPLSTTATLTVSGYDHPNGATFRWACGAGLVKLSQIPNGENTQAVFQLTGLVAGNTYNIVIYEADSDPCP